LKYLPVIKKQGYGLVAIPERDPRILYDLVITYFVAGIDSTTLPIFIFSMLRRGVKPEINAIATLVILASLIIAVIGLYLRSRRVD
jgi:ABC-type spermidine/putrescine transport system permease subunit II